MLMFHYLLLLLKSASYHFARLLRSVDRTTRTVNNEKKKKKDIFQRLIGGIFLFRATNQES